MKVIFLDVDGVLNNNQTRKKFGFDFIDKELVAFVALIVDQTKAKIVLSSSWRVDDKDKQLVVNALAIYGLDLFDCTPHLSSFRHVEIQSWIDNHPEVKIFAILDDWHEAEIQGSFFQTDEDVGLTSVIATKVISHLGSVP
jgi:hypothetical protein